MRRIDQPAPGTQGSNEGVRRRYEDTIPFGDKVVAEGTRQNAVVSIMGSSRVNGDVAEDVVSIMGNTTIASGVTVGGGAVTVLGNLTSDGIVRDDVVAVLGNLISRGHVHHDAVAVLGSSKIDGPVDGDVVAVLGDMELGPNAVIGGDLVVVGGRLTKHPRAIVRGTEVPITGFFTMTGVDWFTTWIERCMLLGRPLAFGHNLGWAWMVAAAFLGLYILLALLFPRGIERCAATLETRPGKSLLTAVLTALLAPVAVLLLIVTGVGIIVVPFVLIALVFAALFGKAAMLAWLGRRFTKFFGDGPLGHPTFAVLVGGAFVLLLYTVPVLGIMVFKLLGWVGFGVVIYALLLGAKRERVPVAAAAGAMTAPAMASASAASAGVVAPLFATGAETVPPTIPPAAIPAPPVMPAPVVPPTTLPRAGFMIRAGGLLIDFIVVAFAVKLASDLFPFFHHNFGPSGVLFMLAVYGAIMWKLKGTTIGGIVCGLKVVRLDGREVDWTTTIVRALGCFLFPGFLWVAFDPERQSWHDKIAGTVVVRPTKGVSLV